MWVFLCFFSPQCFYLSFVAAQSPYVNFRKLAAKILCVLLHRWSHLCCCCCCVCSWDLVKAQNMKTIILASSTTLSMTWTFCSERRSSNTTHFLNRKCLECFLLTHLFSFSPSGLRGNKKTQSCPAKKKNSRNCKGNWYKWRWSAKCR